MSAPDPAAKLQIERISRAGYSCAAAGSGDSATGAKPSNKTALFRACLVAVLRRLGVKLGIMPEDAVLIEGDAPPGREISGNARPRRDAVVKRDRPWVFRLQPLHRS